MPIQPTSSETEQEFIGRCMSEETKDYEQDQAFAICKSKWDRQENMKKMQDLMQSVKDIKRFKS